MTPLQLAQKGYENFLKGNISALVELFSDKSSFTPQMGLEGKIPRLTPKGAFRRDELPGLLHEAFTGG
ncbi:MAG: hypothetical protein WBX25_03780 [Rhodomicrobium sp.]